MNTATLLEPIFFRIHDAIRIQEDDIAALLNDHKLHPGMSHSNELSQRDLAADDVITGAKLWSSLEGVSLGMGGAISLIPSLIGFFRTLLRLVQSMAWVYDAPPDKEEEKRVVWQILAHGLAEKPALTATSSVISGQLAHSLLRYVTKRVLQQFGIQSTSPLAARLIPLIGAIAQGYSHALLAEQIGKLAKEHYREKFLSRFTIERS